MKIKDIDKLFLKTAFSCTACDGDVDVSEIKLIKKLNTAIVSINTIKTGLVTKTKNVTITVNATLISVPLILRLKLPGTSLGAFKKVPKAIAGAKAKRSKRFKTTRGKTIAMVNTTPL